MRLLFLVSGQSWSASARAFVLAARGLSARGHETFVACESECPVQVRAAASDVRVVSLDPDRGAARTALELRRALQDLRVDAVFVHTDAEQLLASSALRLGRGAGPVIRRVPPFALARQRRGARLASRIASTRLLFSTEADLQATRATSPRATGMVAPPAVDPAAHDAVSPAAATSLGAAADARLIVCVHDGSDSARAMAALRTLALLAPRHPDLHLVFVGGGSEDELRMHGAALSVNARVSYLGAREEELAVLKAARAGWIAADGDAAAFAALDFMAFRVPVIAERRAVTEHFVADGITGLLLPAGDAAITASSVAAFLANDEQRVAMGNAGFARLQREFGYDRMIAGFEHSLSGVAAAPVGAPQLAQ